jgi:hypothetical protein
MFNTSYFNSIKRRTPAPQGNIYRRPDTRVEYQIFSEDYFSGADVNIFFGDIWVDEAISLSFQIEESVLPIYGYASYTFDTVARGRRIVSGSFAINFKTTGYLQQILENAMAINYTVQKAQEEGVIQPSDFKKYKLDEILKMYGKESFDQIADEYEKALWGVQEDTKQLLSYGNQTWFPSDSYGFDIKINYGAVSEAMSPGINSYFVTSAKAPPNITVETINGVQLTGMAKQGIGTSFEGQPITEMYSFIARDINGPLYRR